MNILELPNEILYLIFYKLSLTVIKQCIITCISFKYLYNNLDWKNYFLSNIHPNNLSVYENKNTDRNFMLLHGKFLVSNCSSIIYKSSISMNIDSSNIIYQWFRVYPCIIRICSLLKLSSVETSDKYVNSVRYQIHDQIIFNFFNYSFKKYVYIMFSEEYDEEDNSFSIILRHING